MNLTKETNGIGIAAKVGAAAFVLWGILHLWVGYEGIHQYLVGKGQGQWEMLIGGKNAPRATFQHATDPATVTAHAQLILNFCVDVGGYGVLGIVVGIMIWKQASWAAYGIGVLVIGIADLAFLFALVTPGIIELNVATISGPMLWFFAVIITPIGLPRFREQRHTKN